MSERWRMACGSRLAPKKQGSPWLSNIESGRCSECSFIPSRSSRSRGVYSLATFCLSPDCRSNRHWLRIGKNRRYPQIPVLFCPRVPGESASVSVRIEIVCFLGCRAGCGLAPHRRQDTTPPILWPSNARQYAENVGRNPQFWDSLSDVIAALDCSANGEQRHNSADLCSTHRSGG